MGFTISQKKSDRINYLQQSANILSDDPEVSTATVGIWDIFADELVDLWKVLGRRWALLMLKNLNTKEAIRFNELKRLTPGISSTVLVHRLLELEREGIISQRIHQENHPKKNIV